MRPILYEQNERVFDTNGMGILHDAISAEVTEVRNAEFELELKYPVGGEWAKALTQNRYILVKPNDYDEPHAFRIYEVEKEVDSNEITVKAVTKTDELSGNIIKPLSIKSATPSGAWEQLKRVAVDPIEYNFISDIQTSKDTNMDIRNVLNAIAGEEGSFIDTWGGEIKRTNNTIFLYSKRGKDHVTTIRPRKNLKNVKVKSSMAGKFTRILPYVTFTPEGENEAEQVIYGDIIKSPHYDDYFVKRIVPLDLSSEFNDSTTHKEGEEAKKKAPTPAQVTAKAQSYFTSKNKDADKPDLSVEVEMIPLQDSTEWDRRIIQALEKIQLCDTVDVYVPKIDCDVTVKVRKIVYDALRERIIKIEASSSGSGRASLADQQKAQWQDLTNKIVNNALYGEKDGLIHTILTSANNKNKNFYGPEEPPREKVSKDDLWFKPVGGEGEVEMWRFDGENWVLVIDANFGQKVTDKVNDAINSVKQDINANVQATVNAALADAEKRWRPDLTPIQNELDEKLKKIDDDINVKVGDIKDQLASQLERIKPGNPNLLDGTLEMNGGNADDWNVVQGGGGMENGQILGARNLLIDEISGTPLDNHFYMPFTPKSYTVPYTWSFFVKNTSTNNGKIKLTPYDSDTKVTVNGEDLVPTGDAAIFDVPPGTEKYVTVTYPSLGNNDIQLQIREIGLRDGANLYTYKWKVEEGTKATGWVPSAADGEQKWKNYKSTVDGDLASMKRRITDTEGRVTTNSTEIQHLNTGLAAKADQETVNHLDGEIESAKAELNLVPNKISTAISQYKSTVDGQISKVSTSIDQKANEIKIAAQNLEKKVDGNAASTSAELRVIKDSISAKVSRTDLDTVSGQVTAVETNLTTRIDGIQTSVDKVTRDVDGKISSAVSSAITQSEKELGLRITATEAKILLEEIPELDKSVRAYTDTKFNLVDGKIQSQITSRLNEYARTSDVATRVTQEAGKIRTELSSLVDDNFNRNEKFQEVLRTVDIYKSTLGTTRNGITTSISQLIQSSDEIKSVITNAAESNTNLIMDTDSFASAKFDQFSNGVDGYTASAVPGAYGSNEFFYLSKYKIGNSSNNQAFVSLPLAIDKMSNGDYYTISCRYKLDSSNAFRSDKPLNAELQILDKAGYPAYQKIFTLSPGMVQEANLTETFQLDRDRYFDNVNGFNNRFAFRIKLIGEGRIGVKELMLVKGKTVGPYKPAGGVSSTVVTQRANAWALNLTGPKDVITSINADTSGVRLKGKNIVLDGDVIANGRAFIKESWIEDLNASKITAGEINGARVKVINMDASNIVSGTMTAAHIKGGILTSINGDVKFDLDGSNLNFFNNGSIRFHTGSNAIWRQTPDGIHTAFMHFNDATGGGLYAGFGVTSSSDGINSASGGRFAGIRCFRRSRDLKTKNKQNNKLGSHERSVDQIEIYGDEIYFSDDFTLNRGFYFRTDSMPNNGHIDLWATVRYLTAAVYELANVYTHLRNVGWNPNNDDFKRAVRNGLTSVNAIYPGRFKVPIF